MKLSKYYQFIREAEELQSTAEDLGSGSTEVSADISKYTELKDELTEMIKASLNTEDDKTFEDFIDAYNKNPEETQIEGLINDSDIYEFYLKWRNDIDDILSDINYYDEVPSELKVFSLYEYVIQGTKKSVGELISMMVTK
jgi:hypothetical protein